MKAPKNSFRIDPFKGYSANLILDSLMSVSPAVTSLGGPRAGTRRAIKKLRSFNIGIVGKEDVPVIAPAMAILYVEAEYALLSAISIAGYNTEPLSDEMEYQAFEDIALPEQGHEVSQVLWNEKISEAVIRHFNTAAQLRDRLKSYPTYRKSGHDYIEDMLEMCCRIIMRPAIVRFTRFLEKHLGWPSVEESGVLSHVHLKPKFDIPKEGSVQ